MEDEGDDSSTLLVLDHDVDALSLSHDIVAKKISVQFVGFHLTPETVDVLLKLFLERQNQILPMASEESKWDLLDMADCIMNPNLDMVMEYVSQNKVFKRMILRANTAYATIRRELPVACVHDGLQELTISGLYLTINASLRLRRILESTTTLKNLKFVSNSFERYGACQVAEGISRNRSLVTLEYRWRTSVDALVIVHATTKHSTIQHLLLSGDCTPRTLLDVVATDMGQPLQTLTLNDMGLMDFSFLSTPWLNSSSSLQHLDLSDNTMQNYQLDELFGSLRSSKFLVQLDLSRNYISDFARNMLAGEHIISASLKRLNLSHNRLDDHGADEFLCRLWKFPNLNSLDMSYNRLEELEFPRFLKRPKCCSLCHLNLRHHHFTWLEPKEKHIFWLRRLLNRTPLKIGNFWACGSVSLQCRLSTRDLTPVDIENVPISIWSHVLAKANDRYYKQDSTRCASVMYAIIREEAISVMAAQRSRLSPCTIARDGKFLRPKQNEGGAPKADDMTATTCGPRSEFMATVPSLCDSPDGEDDQISRYITDSTGRHQGNHRLSRPLRRMAKIFSLKRRTRWSSLSVNDS